MKLTYKVTRCVLALFSIFLFTQCKKQKSDLVAELKQKVHEKRYPSVTNVAVIYNNDVFYFGNLQSDPVQLTNSSTSKSKVRVSYDGQKVAYLDGSGYPVIVTVADQKSTVLSSYYGTKDLQWSHDNTTLCLLRGNTIAYHGPALNLPSLTRNRNSVAVTAFAVSPGNDVLYSISESTNYYPYTAYVAILKKNGSSEEIQIKNSNTAIVQLQIANGTNEMLIGTGNTGYDNLITNLYAHPYGSPTASNSFSDSYGYITPTYRSDLSFLVTSNSNRKGINASHLIGPSDSNISRTDFGTSSGGNVSSIDWK